MNCEEVMNILDNERIDRLDAGRRRQVDAHLAVCVDCARAWNLQAGLASLPDMAVPADFAARCRALIATGSRPSASRRVTSRMRLAGMFTALAAAAALVALVLWPTAPTAPEHAPHIVETPAIAPIQGGVPDTPTAALAATVAAEHPSAPLFTVRVELPDETEMERNEIRLSPALREAVRTERRVRASNPVRGQAVRSMYAAMFEELREVPGLRLAQPDSAEAIRSDLEYRVWVSGDVVQILDSAVMRADARLVPVAMQAERTRPAGRGAAEIYSAFDSLAIDPQAACSGSEAVETRCQDPRGVARTLVRKLRQDVFPADSSVIGPLQARFKDASLDPAQRAAALEQLYRLQLRAGSMGPLRDADVVRAAIELAAMADPVLRAQIWRSLRGIGSPALLQPLLASLSQDPEDARLAAVETLSADFRDDPRVRPALEAVARGDARPLVRAVAERSLSGEEPWRRYVSASLQDRSLPAAQRMEALVYYLYPPGPTERTASNNPDYRKILNDMLGNDAALRAFAEALPDAGRLRGNDRLLMSNVSYQSTRNPDITAMLLRILQADPEPNRRAVAGDVLARAHVTEPGILDVLIKARDSDPDQSVRNTIRQIIGERRR